MGLVRGLQSGLSPDLKTGLNPGQNAFAVPQTVADYTAIGFPAPAKIWDMRSPSRPFVDVTGGGDPLTASGTGSGFEFEYATGLQNGELAIRRTAANTCISQVADNTLLEIGSDNAVGIGALLKFDISNATNIITGKRATDGWNCRISNGARVWICARPDTGGDVNASSPPDQALTNGQWHYVFWVGDHRPGVKLFKAISDQGETVADSSGKGSFANSEPFGFSTGALAGANTIIAAKAAWTGSDVALLTQALAQAFLTQSGV